MSSTTNSPVRTAIVLGGGGVAGIAWELGLLHGLQDAGVPIGDADLVVGTSAGSMVGALLRFDMIAEGYRQQLDPVPTTYVEPPATDWEVIGNSLAAALAGATSEQDARARIGRAAARVTGGQSDDDRARTFAETFPREGWPTAPLGITAVDAEDGSFRVFTADDDVPLARAIAASCSVPFVWSPVHVDGRRYVDGGVRSVTNADVASRASRVFVVACRTEDPSPTGPSLDRAVAGLRAGGAAVEVVVADEAAQAAYGTDVLALATREPAARAGRAQGVRIAERVSDFWSA
jgi:NTE family protein